MADYSPDAPVADPLRGPAGHGRWMLIRKPGNYEFFSENPDAQLARIDFVRGNYTPIPQVAAEPTTGLAPLKVTFSSAGTSDPDGDPITYAWDFDMDGTVDSTEPNPTFTYEQNGVFDATLKVTDSTGRSAARRW
jgi:cytochrome c